VSNANLKVTVEYGHIIVVRSDTEMWVTYTKEPGSSELRLATSSTETQTPEVVKFHAEAMQAALAKARELGWIPNQG
jgi:hypothetical protein